MPKEIICGLVCECNPYHLGHRKIVKAIKEEYSALVAVMSGPFVQRGRPAILDKWTRAKILVNEGADLVIELPVQAVLQSADYFARGAVKVLKNIPGLGALAYGIEKKAYNNYLAVKSIKALGAIDFFPDQDKIRKHIKAGSSYRKAVSKGLAMDLYPNMILASQYDKSIREMSLDWQLYRLEREIINKDPDNPSAGTIRSFLAKTDSCNAFKSPLISSLPYRNLIKEKIMSESLNYIGDYLLLADLLGKIDFSSSPHYEEGMDIRLMRALAEKRNLEEALDFSANKRQSKSRYRRMVLTGLLEIKKFAAYRLDWIRPLAFNDRGREILKSLDLPIIQKNIDQLSESVKEEFLLNEKAQHLADLMQGRANFDYKEKFYFPNKNK